MQKRLGVKKSDTLFYWLKSKKLYQKFNLRF